MNKKLSYFLLSMLISTMIISIIPTAFAFVPDSEDYPYDTSTVITENESGESMDVALYGTGSYNSIEDGFYYGTLGGKEIYTDGFPIVGAFPYYEFRLYAPYEYEYYGCDFSLYPYMYGIDVQGATYDTFTYGTSTQLTPPMGALYQTFPTITAHEWTVSSHPYTGNYISALYGTGDAEGYASFTEEWAEPEEMVDNVLYPSPVQDSFEVLECGSQSGALVSYVGEIAIAESGIRLDQKPEFSCDPNWILEGITVDFVMGDYEGLDQYSLGYGYQTGAVFAMWNEDIYDWVELEMHTEEANNGWEYTAIYADELFGDPFYEWENPNDEVRFSRFVKTYNINKRLGDIVHTWVGNIPIFGYWWWSGGASGWYAQQARSNILFSEITVQYHLKWDGVGDMYKEAYDDEFGEGLFQFKHDWMPDDQWQKLEPDGDFTILSGIYSEDVDIRCTGDPRWSDCNIKFTHTAIGYYQTSSTDDIILQYKFGIFDEWSTWTPEGGRWSFYTEWLDGLEDWFYKNDAYLLAYFHAFLQISSYADDIRGFVFEVDIDYEGMRWWEPEDWETYSGEIFFTQELAPRAINEHWDTVRIWDSPCLAEAYLVPNPLSLIEMEMEFDNGFPRYEYEASVDINWFGHSEEEVEIVWYTDNDAPIIESALDVVSCVEQKPTRFDVSAFDPTTDIGDVWVFLGERISEGEEFIQVDVFQLTQSELIDTEMHYFDELYLYEGDYTYYYLVRDKGGNFATSEYFDLTVERGEILIEVIQLDDYEEGSTGNSLIFSIADTNGDIYEVWIDMFLEYTGSWIAGDDPYIVDVSIDTYNTGEHELWIYARNTLGREKWLFTSFLVYETPIFIDEPDPFYSLGECTGIQTLIWVLTDDNPSIYTLYHNDIEIESDIWESLVPITFDVDLCEYPQNVDHTFRLVAEDEHDRTVMSESIINLYPVNPLISDEEGGGLYEDEEVYVSWDVSDHCLSHFEIEYYHDVLGWTHYYTGLLEPTLFTQTAEFILDGDDFPISEGMEYEVYQFRCVVYDINDNYAIDEIPVTVYINPPIISYVQDGFYYSDDEDAVLEWTVKDNNLYRYWIEINTSTGYEVIQEGSLSGETEADILLNLYELELDVGFHEIRAFVEDTYGNIVNDTVIVENKGEEAGVEINIGGLLTWFITVFIGVFGLYSVSKSDQWERYDRPRKYQVGMGVAGIVGAILVIISIFGLFPVTFTKLPEVVEGIESSLGGYGLLILILGVAGGIIGGVLGIRYLLERRRRGI